MHHQYVLWKWANRTAGLLSSLLDRSPVSKCILRKKKTNLIGLRQILILLGRKTPSIKLQDAEGRVKKHLKLKREQDAMWKWGRFWLSPFLQKMILRQEDNPRGIHPNPPSSTLSPLLPNKVIPVKTVQLYHQTIWTIGKCISANKFVCFRKKKTINLVGHQRQKVGRRLSQAFWVP